MGNSSWGRRNEALLRTLNALFMGQLVSFLLALTTFTSSLAANLGVKTPLSLSFLVYLSLTLVYGSILLYRRQKLLVLSCFPTLIILSLNIVCYRLTPTFSHSKSPILSFILFTSNVSRKYLNLRWVLIEWSGVVQSFMQYLCEKIVVSWYWYALLGFVDVQGNYLRNKAYHYSSITSVALLDCFTIAWVIILTWIFLGTRYTLRQFFGAAVCILGLCLVLLSDSGVGGGGGSKPLLGDILVIVATFFYAISNSGEEFCIKRKDRVELLAMMGLYGLLVTVCEIGMLERKNLELVKWSTEIILIFAGYGVGTFLFYISLSFSIKMSGATMLNLSLLTSDMWAVVIRIFFYRQQVDWLYYFSFAIVVIGLVIYSKFEKDHAPLPALEDGNFNPEYQRLNGESADSRVEPVGS